MPLIHVRQPSGDTEQGLARFLRRGAKQGHGEKDMMEVKKASFAEEMSVDRIYVIPVFQRR